ncbi:CGNR zinc finger domain-containing protein [Allokutzneria albata]|uniref:CGNR zinc finger domain-containing protein n=1 Tax=Allokutzneria albata TaxID=211114 RepID=UPI0018D4A656|nr:CGNR zinc finger domain-containing protein [Allokutzneria albata]
MRDVSVEADGSAKALTGKGALGVIALHAIRLALSPSARPVRSCDGCGWFFIDTSRGRRRRWCSMKTCGNQAKVARFRARDQSAPPPPRPQQVLPHRGGPVPRRGTSRSR